MKMRRKIVQLSLLLSLLISAQWGLGKNKQMQDADVLQMNAQRRVVHVLNRLTFGPRPGDLERVTAMGVNQWVEQQLYPEKIDDSALDARLAPFRTLHLETREIVENFPPPEVIRTIAERPLPLPSDPLE